LVLVESKKLKWAVSILLPRGVLIAPGT